MMFHQLRLLCVLLFSVFFLGNAANAQGRDAKALLQLVRDTYRIVSPYWKQLDSVTKEMKNIAELGEDNNGAGYNIKKVSVRNWTELPEQLAHHYALQTTKINEISIEVFDPTRYAVSQNELLYCEAREQTFARINGFIEELEKSLQGLDTLVKELESFRNHLSASTTVLERLRDLAANAAFLPGTDQEWFFGDLEISPGGTLPKAYTLDTSVGTKLTQAERQLGQVTKHLGDLRAAKAWMETNTCLLAGAWNGQCSDVEGKFTANVRLTFTGMSGRQEGTFRISEGATTDGYEAQQATYQVADVKVALLIKPFVYFRILPNDQGMAAGSFRGYFSVDYRQLQGSAGDETNSDYLTCQLTK